MQLKRSIHQSIRYALIKTQYIWYAYPRWSCATLYAVYMGVARCCRGCRCTPRAKIPSDLAQFVGLRSWYYRHYAYKCTGICHFSNEKAEIFSEERAPPPFNTPSWRLDYAQECTAAAEEILDTPTAAAYMYFVCCQQRNNVDCRTLYYVAFTCGIRFARQDKGCS